MIVGDELRDWVQTAHDDAIFPYTEQLEPLPSLSSVPSTAMFMWPFRSTLEDNKMFGKQTKIAAGLHWYEFGRLTKSKLLIPLSITFAEIATHNHFVLDRGGKVFKQTAPVIKLPADASVDDHLRLLGVLNSSVACFWLKQNCFNKGRPGAEQAGADEPWEHRYQFNGTALQGFPLPAARPPDRAAVLDDLAHQLQQQTPAAIAGQQTPTHAALEAARHEFDRVRALMIAHQEELDWEYYRIYDLTEDDLTYRGELPGIGSAERVFAVALARELHTEVSETTWFTHHNHRFTPTTDIPDHLPADYRQLLERRLDTIDSNPNIRLLERPEYKRRWAMEPWDKQVESTLRGWLLDRIEDRALWFDRDGRPTPRSVAQLADVLDRDADFRDVLRLWVGDANAATGGALAKLLTDEVVPFLAAHRYKPSGLDKYADWEHTWSLQRREDAGDKLDASIPVPPKYTSADFVKTSYWSHRGKLDVPKERFISYPNAGRNTDPTELLGWAGWDHADQALALASLVSARTDEGWDTPRLIPLLAGLHELAPWVRQWHNAIDPEYGESVADTIDDELAARLAEQQLTVTDLTGWRPAPSTRGRRAKKA